MEKRTCRIRESKKTNSIKIKKFHRLIFLLLFLFFWCGPPKPDTMPEPIDIYIRYSNEELEKMLNSNQWIDRSNAILYIQQNQIKGFTNKIYLLLQKDPNASVRQISALTLADFHYKPAVPIILQLLKKPQINSEEKIDINFLLEAIGKFKDYNAIKEVLFYLNDDDLTRRLRIIKILEENSNDFSISQRNELGKIILSYAIKNQDSDKARTFAMALGRIQYKLAERLFN